MRDEPLPRAKQNQTLARQWEILKRLPAKGPGVTARELAEWLADEGFPTAKRTVERDLVELSRLFPLDCNDKGTPYGWRWMEGEGPDLPGLSVADAVSLRLVEDLLRPLLPSSILDALEPRFRQARRKLKVSESESRNARWSEKVQYVPPALPLVPPRIAAGVLEAVQEALLAGRQLEIDYQRRVADEPARMTLHPLGLVQRGPVTYLVATAFDYTDVRIYAVHRIHWAGTTSDPVRRSEGFTLESYVSEGALQFGVEAPIALEAWVSDETSRILQETPLGAGQTLEPASGGGCHLSVTLKNSWQLRWWILSQGENIVVKMPASLRAKISATARAVSSRYED